VDIFSYWKRKDLVLLELSGLGNEVYVVIPNPADSNPMFTPNLKSKFIQIT
jgi:hypothetical protein